jgi:hypothetical protein
LTKFIWRNKVYQDVRLVLSWGPLSVGEATYQLVRCVVYERQDKPLFKDCMLLITNESVANFEQA